MRYGGQANSQRENRTEATLGPGGVVEGVAIV